MILDIFPTHFCEFKKYQKILNLIILDFYGPAEHQCPKKFNIIWKYKDNVFMYNIHIHDKVRVLGIGRNQNQKLCNLYSFIINGWNISIEKRKILDNQGNF